MNNWFNIDKYLIINIGQDIANTNNNRTIKFRY